MSASSSFLEQYEPLDVIGNGSFGIIRKVRRKSDGLIFARKELNFERMSERDRKQIVAEVNILKDLHHEHIVAYHDRYVDRDAGILYILMEYCGGGDLSGIIKQASKQNRPISEDTIWNYFMQILLALHHCHHPNGHGRSGSGSGSGLTSDGEGSSGCGRRPQILHRDLKPDNVFLDENNNVKLGDFGLSKALAQASFANTYVGTPYYMSPELMQEKAYDSKSDIWSLGCLIYELCALKPPFHEAKTHSELSILIRNGRIPPLPRGYSQSLFGVIKAMLNLNPAMRPSAAQLLQHERLELVFRVSEAEKMLSQLKSHKNTIVHRERDVAHREQIIGRREQELAAIISRKDQEILHLQQVVSQLQHQTSSTPASSLSISNHLSQLTPEDFQRIPAVQRLVESAIQGQLEVAVKHAVAKREEELRMLVIKREEEVANAISKREEEIMEAVRRREQEVCEAWTRREEEMRREVEQWVAKREKEVREIVEREVLERIEKERLEELEAEEAEEREREQREREQREKEKEREQRVRRERKDGAKGTRGTKTPLEEVKNTLPQQPASRKNTMHETPVSTIATTRRTRFNSHTNNEATAKPTSASTVPSSTAAFPSSTPSAFPLETPVAPRPSLIDAPPPSILQSAMKGVVLTATGEVLATPSPTNANAQVEKSVQRLFEECSPKVGLNFGKIFERRESSSTLSFGSPLTNGNGAAANGIDRSPSTSSTNSADDGEEPPSPTTRKELEKRRASGAVREKPRSREGSRETSPLAPSQDEDNTVTMAPAPAPSIREHQRDTQSASTAAVPPPTRIRRPSMRGHRRNSSIPPTSVSVSGHAGSVSAMGSVDDGSVSVRQQQLNPPQPLPHPHLSGITRSVSVPVLPISSAQQPPAPEYDFSDPENLPSPFLRKTDRYATVPASASSSGERTSSAALFAGAGGGSSSSASSTLSSASSSLSLASAVTTASSSSSSSSGSSSSGKDRETPSPTSTSTSTSASASTTGSNGTVKMKKRASTTGGNLLRAVAAANSVQRARKGSVGASPLVSAGLYPDSASVNGSLKKANGEKVGAR